MKWINLNEQLPDNGIEVICFNPKWINEDFNPKGIRVGFLNGENEFTTAHWWDYQDTYMTISKSDVENDQTYSDDIRSNTEPTHWMPLPESPKTN